MLLVHWTLVAITVVGLTVFSLLLTMIFLLARSTRYDIYHSRDGQAYYIFDV